MTIADLIGKMQGMLLAIPHTEDAADFVLRSLSQLQLDRIRARHADNRHLKYVDELERFVRRDLNICKMLGLDRAPPQRVLDIGCGAGLLLHCMQRYGHTGLGIDVPDSFYADMALAYGVDRRIQAVQPFKPLQLDGQFDLVTCIAVCFDRLRDDRGGASHRHLGRTRMALFPHRPGRQVDSERPRISQAEQDRGRHPPPRCLRRRRQDEKSLRAAVRSGWPRTHASRAGRLPRTFRANFLMPFHSPMPDCPHR